MTEALGFLSPYLSRAPFALAIREAVIDATRTIFASEIKRRSVKGAERSKLSPENQPYQDFIDAVVYAMAGSSSKEVTALEGRLEKMP